MPPIMSIEPAVEPVAPGSGIGVIVIVCGAEVAAALALSPE
jgi:hypothetical protein